MWLFTSQEHLAWSTSSSLWFLALRISKVLKARDSGTLQFSETCVHREPHGLRMKDQLLTSRPRAYKDLSFGKQFGGGTYPSAKRITELHIVSCHVVILYDTHVFDGRCAPGTYHPKVLHFLRPQIQVLVSPLLGMWLSPQFPLTENPVCQAES